MNNLLNFNNSIPIIVIPSNRKVQARKHKKKRINKKWLKRYGYITIGSPMQLEDDKILAIGGKLYMNEKAYQALLLSQNLNVKEKKNV